MNIKRFFFDIDENIAHSLYNDPNQDHIFFEIDGSKFYTIIHPHALEVIEYTRNLLGKENVYILTAAIKEYAEKINELAGFGFDKDHIFAREDMENNEVYMAYGARYVRPHALAGDSNMIVDNLPFHFNKDKTQFMGILKHNYLNVPDYYGVNTKDAMKYFDRVKKFLK
jgi:hypothetical protein